MKNYLKLSAWLFLIPGTDVFIVQGRRQIGRRPVAGSEKPLSDLAGDGQVILNWDAPLSGEVKEYSVTWTPGNGSATVNGMAYTATGLTNRHRIHFFGESRLRVRVVPTPLRSRKRRNRSDQLHGLHGRSSPGGL